MSAVIVGVLAFATLAIGESGGGDLTNLSERRLIEAHLEAWYGGDFDAVPCSPGTGTVAHRAIGGSGP